MLFELFIAHLIQQVRRIRNHSMRFLSVSGQTCTLPLTVIFRSQPKLVRLFLSMPTVLRVDGFAVRIYTDDHQPPHVHVVKAGVVVVIALAPVQILRVESMRRADIVAALAIVEANREYLVARWSEIHG